MSHDWRKIGARSRSRGYRFEKHVEKTLEWQRVPMSGSAGSAFGSGDVIDGYINGAGYWLAECKARTSESVSIDGKWIEKARKDAEKTGRFVVIVTGTKHEGTKQKPGQAASKPEAWVFLDLESMRFLTDAVRHHENPPRGGIAVELLPDDTYRTKSTSKSGGFCVRRSWLEKRPGIVVVDVRVEFEGQTQHWMMMTLERFKEVIDRYDAFVRNTHKED